MELASFGVALAIGFFSSTHCLAMCGGIMGALTMALPEASAQRKGLIILLYNVGRIGSYTLMGALVGVLGEGLSASGGGPALRVVAAMLLIAMALYLTNIWRGLTYLERVGQTLWQGVQPLGRRLLPVRSPAAALLLGGLWGWLPCGLVYTALGYAMTLPGPWQGALAMFSFGLGTLPAVFLAGVLAGPLGRFARARWVRWGSAILLVLFAVWTLYGALGGHHGHHHQGHVHHATGEHSQDHHADDHIHSSNPASSPAPNHHDHSTSEVNLGHSASKDREPQSESAAENHSHHHQH